MDPGTDVVDILAGRVIPLRLGYVPVVNRGQKDIDSRKAIAKALENEKQFFESHPAYQSKAQYCGTPFLAKKLNILLMHHIRTCLPDIKAKISSNLQAYQAELMSLGDITEDSPQVIQHQLTSILGLHTVAEYHIKCDYRVLHGVEESAGGSEPRLDDERAEWRCTYQLCVSRELQQCRHGDGSL